ncbi:MAG: glycoside hydrolase family 113 [Candidatus Heimdallarchaeota archaeon]
MKSAHLPAKMLCGYWLIVVFLIATPNLGFFQLTGSTRRASNSTGDDFLRGTSFTAFSEYAFHSAFSNQSLQQFKDDGGEWVALCFWWFVDNLTATNIHPDFDEYSCRNETLRLAIARARELGLKIMLKPMIDTVTGDWRAYIEPSEAWFNAYDRFIVDWAKFAQKFNIELLCIGCEFSLSESFDAKWREIIQDVRGVYAGNLTYAANYDSYDKITWWDAVDYIGIDAYFSLTEDNSPPLEDLIARWSTIKQTLKEYANAQHQTIIFTEVGYRSINGCNREPWNWQRDARVDLDEQAMCYEALLRSLWGENWLQGIFWWDWTPYNSTNWLKDKGYTCQFKPAEAVLRAWYSVPFSVTPDFSTVYNQVGFTWIEVVSLFVMTLEIIALERKLKR